MGAIRAKLEAFKQPKVVPVKGHVTMPKLTPGKTAQGKAFDPRSMLSMLRTMQNAQARREESVVMNDAMATKRSGTMDNLTVGIEGLDAGIAQIDELLNSLNAQ